MIPVESTLTHHGIKGMKWGVRRNRTETTSSTTKEASSEDATRAKTSQARIKKSGTDALSNQDLQHLVNRMNLEQQYSRLSSGDGASKIKKGQDSVNKILGPVKTLNEIYNVVNSPLGKQIKSMLGT